MLQILTFTSQRKSRGLPSRPRLPRFDHILQDVNAPPAAQSQTTYQGSSNIPNIIEGIDKLQDREGPEALPLTIDDKMNMWKNEVNLYDTSSLSY